LKKWIEKYGKTASEGGFVFSGVARVA